MSRNDSSLVTKLTVLNSNVFATRMLGRAKQWRGETVKQPVKIAKNSLGSSFSGFDTFSTSATNNRVNLSYNPAFYEIPVALPLTELSVNKGDEKVLDLAAVELASAAQDLADDVGTLFYGDGGIYCAVLKVGKMLENLVKLPILAF